MDVSVVEAFILAGGAIGFGAMLLVKGGDWTVDTAVYFAKKFGVSQLIIGFTILAFGTSLPEFIVSLLSNLRGSPGIAIGNVIGSNIANIAFIIGFVAIFTPLVKKSQAIGRDLIFMLVATVIFAGLLQYGYIGYAAGGGMLALLVAYVWYQYYTATRSEQPQYDDDDDETDFKSMGHAVMFLLLGLGAIAVGAEFLVRGATIGAVAVGVPEAVIALSLVAFGTSLPELSTSLIAAKKGHSDMVFGNIIGSNVFNILLIIGAVSIVKPISSGTFAQQLIDFDIWMALGVSILFAVILFLRKSIGRYIGLALFSGYILYNIYIYALYVSP